MVTPGSLDRGRGQAAKGVAPTELADPTQAVQDAMWQAEYRIWE
jgi:hypothetical protein